MLAKEWFLKAPWFPNVAPFKPFHRYIYLNEGAYNESFKTTTNGVDAHFKDAEIMRTNHDKSGLFALTLTLYYEANVVALIDVRERIDYTSLQDEFSFGMRLMAHNAKFDMSFLDVYMKKELGKGVRMDSMDTLLLSRAIVKDVPNYKLETLANRFNIDYSGAHRSLRDCEITLDVYNNIRKMYNGE